MLRISLPEYADGTLTAYMVFTGKHKGTSFAGTDPQKCRCAECEGALQFAIVPFSITCIKTISGILEVILYPIGIFLKKIIDFIPDKV